MKQKTGPRSKSSEKIVKEILTSRYRQASNAIPCLMAEARYSSDDGGKDTEAGENVCWFIYLDPYEPCDTKRHPDLKGNACMYAHPHFTGQPSYLGICYRDGGDRVSDLGLSPLDIVQYKRFLFQEDRPSCFRVWSQI